MLCAHACGVRVWVGMRVCACLRVCVSMSLRVYMSACLRHLLFFSSGVFCVCVLLYARVLCLCSCAFVCYATVSSATQPTVTVSGNAARSLRLARAGAVIGAPLD